MEIGDYSTETILGSTVFIIGILLWLYTFYIAYNYVIGVFVIDDTFIIRFIFLLIMCAIGIFLVKKSRDLIPVSKKRTYAFFSIGIIFLVFCLLIANYFLIARYAMVPYLLLVLIFYFYLVGLGVYCIWEGVHEYKEMKKRSVSNVDKNILPEPPNIEKMDLNKNAKTIPTDSQDNKEAQKTRNIAEENLGLFHSKKER